MSITTVGILILTASGLGLAVAIWRFEWMRRYVPFILYWGRWPWQFPATRIGVITGFTTGVTLGCLCLDSKFEFLPWTVWLGILAAVFISVIGAAIHDYLLHRKHDKITAGHAKTTTPRKQHHE